MEDRRNDSRIGVRSDRLRVGEWLIGLAGLALAIDVVALPWYRVRQSVGAAPGRLGGATSATGWQAHHILGPLTLVCALLAVACWGLQATQRAPALPVSLTGITALISLGLAIALLVRVLSGPPGGLLPAAGTHAVSTGVPAVLGVMLPWVLLSGAWISLRADGIAPADAPRQIETLSVHPPPAEPAQPVS